jgi:hypothetical protein
MQQRQYRPGDVLDDYCPRERRVTDHAIVAMVESEIQRTRCVVCDAEHEFKNARVPAPRKKGGNSTSALFTQVLDNLDAPASRLTQPAAADASPPTDVPPERPAAEPDRAIAADAEPAAPEPADDRPFRRSLIRAQLPRPEGQAPPTRAIPEFTMHQPQNLRPRRANGGRFRRHPGGGADFAGPMRSGRPGGQPHGNGNGAGNGQGGRRRRRKKH